MLGLLSMEQSTLYMVTSPSSNSKSLAMHGGGYTVATLPPLSHCICPRCRNTSRQILCRTWCRLHCRSRHHLLCRRRWQRVSEFQSLCRQLGKSWGRLILLLLRAADCCVWVCQRPCALQKHLAGSSVPVLLVASKSDRPAVRQDYPIQPAEFCRRHGLPPPQRFTCAVPPSRDVYVKLATMAAYP